VLVEEDGVIARGCGTLVLRELRKRGVLALEGWVQFGSVGVLACLPEDRMGISYL